MSGSASGFSESPIGRVVAIEKPRPHPLEHVGELIEPKRQSDASAYPVAERTAFVLAMAAGAERDDVRVDVVAAQRARNEMVSFEPAVEHAVAFLACAASPLTGDLLQACGRVGKAPPRLRVWSDGCAHYRSLSSGGYPENDRKPIQELTRELPTMSGVSSALSDEIVGESTRAS